MSETKPRQHTIEMVKIRRGPILDALFAIKRGEL